jgi:outer membrane lipoprotein-sorting protein
MKDDRRLQNIIKNELDVRAGDRTYNRMHKLILDAHESSKKKTSAARLTIPRRFSMRKPMIKFAAAGVIIAAVVLGLFEVIDTNNKSGVVIADVVRKVEISRGVIYHEKIDNNNPKAISDYAIIHLSPTKYRSESFKSGELWLTMYEDREERKRVVLLHHQKAFVKEEMKLTEDDQQILNDIMSPAKWVQNFQSCDYSELGQKTIEGVLCEGFETTDPAFMGVDVPPELKIDGLVAHLWVSVETGYPVLLESEFEGKYSGKTSFDQFQWNVELEPSVFEPNIPPDYEQM